MKKAPRVRLSLRLGRPVAEQLLDPRKPALAGRHRLDLLDGPGPQRAPQIHHGPQLGAGAAVLVELAGGELTLFGGLPAAPGSVRGRGRGRRTRRSRRGRRTRSGTRTRTRTKTKTRLGLPPERDRLAELRQDPRADPRVLGPELVDHPAKPLQARDVELGEGQGGLLAPALEPVYRLGTEPLHHLVLLVGGHPRVGHQEVIDRPLGAGLAGGEAGRRQAQPVDRARLLVGLAQQIGGGVDLPPGADQAVADPQAEVEKRRLDPGLEHAEPERDLAELRRQRVQVDAVAAAVDKVVLHPRELCGVVLGRDELAALGLLALQVGAGELAHRLAQERPGAHRRLADRQV